MTLVKSYNNINPDSSSFTDYISLEFPAKSNHDCCIIINQSNVFCEADHRRNKWIYMEMEKAGKGSEGWGSCGVCCVMRCKPWLLLDGWMEVLKSRSCPALPRKRSARKSGSMWLKHLASSYYFWPAYCRARQNARRSRELQRHTMWRGCINESMCGSD